MQRLNQSLGYVFGVREEKRLARSMKECYPEIEVC
jgi:hypothetical protein